jgi:hypothetical protein
MWEVENGIGSLSKGLEKLTCNGVGIFALCCHQLQVQNGGARSSNMDKHIARGLIRSGNA